MNKIFKVVWSKVKHCYVVVSEIAKNTMSGSACRCRMGRVSLVAAVAAALLTGSWFAPSSVWAAPGSFGKSYEAMVVLSAVKDETTGSTTLGITLYRGDDNTHEGYTYMTAEEAKNKLGKHYVDGYNYTTVSATASADFTSTLNQTIINDIIAMVEGGKNIYVTGDGSDTSPYVINAKDTYNKSVELKIEGDELVVSVTDTDGTTVNKALTGSVKISDIIAGGTDIHITGLEQSINNYGTIVNDESVDGVITTTIMTNEIQKDEEGNQVTDENGNPVYKSYTTTVDISDYVGDKIFNEAGDAIYNQITEEGNTTTTTIKEQISNNVTNIANNTQNIANLTEVVGKGWTVQVGENTYNVTPDNNQNILGFEEGANTTISLEGNIVKISATDTTLLNNADSYRGLDIQDGKLILTVKDSGTGVVSDSIDLDDYIKQIAGEGIYTGDTTINNQINNILTNIEELKDNDIHSIVVAANQTANGGTIDLLRNDKNSEGDATSVASTLNFVSGGGSAVTSGEGENATSVYEDTWVKVYNAENEAGFKLSTGSKVVGEGYTAPGQSGNNIPALKSISINGQKFTVPVINANPEVDGDYVLTSLNINGVNYKVAQSIEGQGHDWSLTGEVGKSEEQDTNGKPFGIQSSDYRIEDDGSIKLNMFDNLNSTLELDKIVIKDVASRDYVAKYAGDAYYNYDSTEENHTTINQQISYITNAVETGWTVAVGNNSKSISPSNNRLIFAGAGSTTVNLNEDSSIITITSVDNNTQNTVSASEGSGISITESNNSNGTTNYGLSVNMEEIKSAVDTNTTYTSDSGIKNADGSTTYTIAGSDNTSYQIVDTNTQNTVSASEGSGISITESNNGNGTTNYGLSVNMEEIKSAVDTNTTYTSDGGVKNADGSTTYTITGSDNTSYQIVDTNTQNTVSASEGSGISITESNNGNGTTNYALSVDGNVIKQFDTNTINKDMFGTGWSDDKKDSIQIQVNDSAGNNVSATISDVAKASVVGADSKETIKTVYKETTYLKEKETVVDATVELDKQIEINRQAIVNNAQNIQSINTGLNRLNNRVNKVGAGAAALAALHPMDFDPDDKLTFSAGVGHYAGENAAAVGAFYRPTEKVMFSVGGTYGNDEDMFNMGVSFALDKPNNVSNSRVAMAREIQDLREQVAALSMLVAQMAAQNNPAIVSTVMFPDVPENHWAYDYIDSLQKRGIIEGYPSGNYDGDRTLTRYEFAAALCRALEKGFPVDSRLLDEFKAELGRIRVDRIKGEDTDANKIERVRVNNYVDRDDYGSKVIMVNTAK